MENNIIYHEYKSGAKTKGYIKNKTTGEIKNFMFNPAELDFDRSATYSEISSPGLSYPLTQYVRGNPIVFTIPIYIYDRPYSGAVSDWEKFLDAFVPPTENTSGYIKPNEMLVVMGSFIRNCVAESVNVHYSSFTQDLLPDEATITLSLRQV